MSPPCDWDSESYCTVEDCHAPATHRDLTAIIGDSPIYEMVCCAHAEVMDANDRRP